MQTPKRRKYKVTIFSTWEDVSFPIDLNDDEVQLLNDIQSYLVKYSKIGIGIKVANTSALTDNKE